MLNASGGMESGLGEDYALRLNRDAQVAMLQAATEKRAPGSRVVFVTSHQAHFIDQVETMDAYEPVARSKRAGELAFREFIPALEAKGIGFVVVSGDMIEGTITATLLDRAEPGASRHAVQPPASCTRLRNSARRLPPWSAPMFRPATPNTWAGPETSSRSSLPVTTCGSALPVFGIVDPHV